MKFHARSSHHLFLPCIYLFFSCLSFFLPQQRENFARLVDDLLIWKYSDRQQRHVYLLYGNKKAVQNIFWIPCTAFATSSADDRLEQTAYQLQFLFNSCGRPTTCAHFPLLSVALQALSILRTGQFTPYNCP